MSSQFLRLCVRALLLVILLQLLDCTRCEGITRDLDEIGVPRESKRVPQGFVGMRGKKYLDYDDTGTYKRRQGFFGVKGKKDLLNYLYYPYELYSFYKRAPTGFVGMRGKKYFEPIDYTTSAGEYVPKRGTIIGQIDYSSKEEIDNNFSILDELIQRYILEKSEAKYDADRAMNEVQNSNNSIDDTNSVDDPRSVELTKRAAQMNQFFGMRGKKSDSVIYHGNKRPFDLSFRGKFVGVRGKKNVNEINFEGFEKRKGPGSGFFGMRGKKWNEPEYVSEDALIY